MIFHIDGNSFYASCERLFRPDLHKSPIAVLSNNDGIVVALNAECKALGFKRGDVFVKVRHKIEDKGVAVFSSNYTLYADMSARMNLIYSRFAPEVEAYSIDESFLFFPKWRNADYTAIANDLKETVTKETGIPVSIGIAPNKTLAKMCNKLAKKREGIKMPGVCNWQELNQDEELAKYLAGDIWGIGYSKTAFLKRKGIVTALDLKRYPLHKAKKHLTLNGFRTVQELNGIAVIGKIESDSAKGAAPRQVIMVSRSFQSPVFELDHIITALAEYTQEAVKRMRTGRLSCRFVSVYLMTNAFAEGEQYFNQLTTELPYPSAYLPEITSAANALLKRIYRPSFKYRKVMIGLTGLEHETSQLELFENQAVFKNRKVFKHIMQAFDTINGRYSRGTMKLACCVAEKTPPDIKTSSWQLRRDFLSPRYTTNIEEIPLAY